MKTAGCPAADLLASPPPAQQVVARPLPHERLPGTLLSWARTFPGTPQQAHSVRRFVSDLLMGSPLRDDAVTVVSELFANAVLHTGSGKPGGLATLQVSRWRLGVRIAVTDQGADSKPVVYDPAAASEIAESGNGLFMVRCLASHLYWHDDASGRTICAILGQLPPDQHPALGPEVLIQP